MKKISILHPSRSRPEMAMKTLRNWLDNADNLDNIEYIISLDTSDPFRHDYFSHLQKLTDDGYFKSMNAICHTNDNKSAIEAINVVAKECNGDLFIVISDDFESFKCWDTALLEALDGKSDFIVKTQDGIQKTLITLPILDREYYNRFGYVYENSYVHMSSDVEMTMVGFALDKIITLPLLFPHNHYSVGGMKKDATNDRNDLSYSQGHVNLNRRKRINFGLKTHEIVKDFRKIVWH